MADLTCAAYMARCAPTRAANRVVFFVLDKPCCLQDEGRLRTNNQWLSLTDQLNLGARLIELDTHWFDGALRIAHCGGLHVPAVNRFFKILNRLATAIGHPLRWDTETFGCSPSLSSIPAGEQRMFEHAVEEVAGWMKAEENLNEFVVLFFDDEQDLLRWVRSCTCMLRFCVGVIATIFRMHALACASARKLSA